MFPRQCPMNKKNLLIIFSLLVFPVSALGQDCKTFSYDRWKAKLSFCAPSEWESFVGTIDVEFSVLALKIPEKFTKYSSLSLYEKPGLKTAGDCHKFFLTNVVQGLAAQLNYQDIKSDDPVDFKTDAGIVGARSVITYTASDTKPKMVIYGFQLDDIVQCYILDTRQSDTDSEKSVDKALKTLKLYK